MDISEIGEGLKNERVNQGYTLEDVHNETKISPYVLQRIEQGVLDGLPHPVYVKGFIKSYADFLGLDAEDLGRQFTRNMSMEDEESENGYKSISPSRHRAKFILVIILLMLMIAGWFVFKGFYLNSFQDSEKVDNQIQKDTDEIKSEEVSKKDFASVNASSDKNRDFNKTESIQKIMQKNQTGENNNSSQKSIDKESNFHVLTVVAQEPCWLQAEMDGNIKDVYLYSGEDLDLKFFDSLQLKLGNAGGVKLRYDGEEYPLDAEPGEVKILNFP